MSSPNLPSPGGLPPRDQQALTAFCRMLASALPCHAVFVATAPEGETGVPLLVAASEGDLHWENAPFPAFVVATLDSVPPREGECRVHTGTLPVPGAPEPLSISALGASLREERGRPWGALVLARRGGGGFTDAARREVEQSVLLAESLLAGSTARLALATSEERFHSLLDTAGDILFCHDTEGRFVWTNRAASEITGFTEEELLAMRVDQLLAPDCLDLLRQRAQSRRAGNFGRSTCEYVFVAKDGRRIPVEVCTSALTRKGQVVAVHGIARDTTERKQLEEQLRQSQKLDAIGRLAGGVAHDFNNILAVINGYASMLLGQLQPEADPVALRTGLGEILKAGESAADLTRQLLAFSRKSLITPRVLQFQEVLHGMEGMLCRLIGEDIHLRVASAPNLWPVRADPSQLQQVVLNLAINARDAMPRGGTLSLSLRNYLHEVTSSSHPSLRPGPYVLLQVRDDGEGMDAETLDQLFEPFFTTRSGGKGTGLGLATVYGIVQQSEGAIEVESAPGTGALFRVFLPAVCETEEAPIPDTAPRAPAPGQTILLVEDEPMLLRLVRMVLTQAGYEVLDAGAPGEALLRAKGHEGKLDLLLTDVVMPGMGGRELAERLRNSCPTLKVLFMSGYTDDAVLRYGVSAAETAFIQKPFTPAELLEQVVAVLGAPG